MRFYSMFVPSILFVSQALAQRSAGVTISAGRFVAINATLKVPLVLGPNISAAAPYVALDDDNLRCRASVRVGVRVYADAYGKFSCIAWYQRKPGALQYLGLNISAGHIVRISWDWMLHTISVENLSTGLPDTVTFWGGASEAYCGASATWGLSAFPMGGNGYLPIANFSEIVLVNATARDLLGKISHPENSGATISNMTLPDDVTLITTGVSNGTVTFSYVDAE